MDVTESLEAPCDAPELFGWIDDLSRYPHWHSIVVRAEPDTPDHGDPGPAWRVDLRGRLGPFARSKRLRMVRTEHEPPRRARFERREVDGRHHAPWVLEATVQPDESNSSASRLTMHLHYGGPRWLPVVDRLLAEEIRSSRQRLLDAIAAR